MKGYAPTPCLHPKCYEAAVYRGRCAEHKQAWQGSTRKERLPADWAARRDAILRRDDGICYICNNPGADGVDHVKAGDDHSFENLKAVHDKTPPFCHRYKTSQEGAQAQHGSYNPQDNPFF